MRSLCSAPVLAHLVSGEVATPDLQHQAWLLCSGPPYSLGLFFSWSRVTLPRYLSSGPSQTASSCLVGDDLHPLTSLSQLSASSLTAFPQFTSASNALWLTGIPSCATRVAKELCMQIPGKHDDQQLFLQLTQERVFSVHHLTFFLSLWCWELTQGLAQTKHSATELSLQIPSIFRCCMVLELWAPSLLVPHASPSPLLVGRLLTVSFIAQAGFL